MFLDRWPKVHGLLHVERKTQRLIVLGPDVNRVFVANDIDIAGFCGKANGVSERAQAIFDLRIAPQSRKPTFLLHCVAKTIVIEKILGRVQSEVNATNKDREHYHAAKAARAATQAFVTTYHWDCAP
jgi:hypothetical protein